MPTPDPCPRCRLAPPADPVSGLCAACRGAVAGSWRPTASTAGPARPGSPSVTPRSGPADRHGLAAAPPPESPPGYELLSRLGTGGMGTVFLARELAAERLVAIKFLRTPADPHAVDRFLVEVRALAAVDHPNIVQVIHVETNRREPFFTMEYAPGGTLADLVRDGPPPAPAVAARLVLGAAEGVAAAHAARLLHRDLKPSNILLTGPAAPGERPAAEAVTVEAGATLPPGHARVAKVSDFGLAKRTDRDDGLTRSGPLGTPSYMSPEAAGGRPDEVGPAADVYGLGATLYFLLTGRPPYRGADHAATLRLVAAGPPDRPRAVRPEIPAGLEAIALKAMERDPAARYPTAAALAADLGRFLAGGATLAPVLGRRRRTGQWLRQRRAGILTAAAAGACGVGLVWLGSVVPSGRTSEPAPVRDPRQVVREEIAAGRAARLLGPDGLPRWAGWPLGAADVAGSADDRGTCSVQTPDARILLLLDDPGVTRYRLTATVRERAKAGLPARPSRDAAFETVGLVLGYGVRDGAAGCRSHTFQLLGFSEAGSADPAERSLNLADLVVVAHPLQAAGILRVGGPGARIDPFGPDAPAWRRIGVQVTPAGITPLASGPAAPYPAATIALDRGILGSQLARTRAGTGHPLPAWEPRLPIGVWCNGAHAEIRDVTLEALD